jgi:hypothetical protein
MSYEELGRSPTIPHRAHSKVLHPPQHTYPGHKHILIHTRLHKGTTLHIPHSHAHTHPTPHTHTCTNIHTPGTSTFSSTHAYTREQPYTSHAPHTHTPHPTHMKVGGVLYRQRAERTQRLRSTPVLRASEHRSGSSGVSRGAPKAPSPSRVTTHPTPRTLATLASSGRWGETERRLAPRGCR